MRPSSLPSFTHAIPISLILDSNYFLFILSHKSQNKGRSLYLSQNMPKSRFVFTSPVALLLFALFLRQGHYKQKFYFALVLCYFFILSRPATPLHLSSSLILFARSARARSILAFPSADLLFSSKTRWFRSCTSASICERQAIVVSSNISKASQVSSRLRPSRRARLVGRSSIATGGSTLGSLVDPEATGGFSSTSTKASSAPRFFDPVASKGTSSIARGFAPEAIGGGPFAAWAFAVGALGTTWGPPFAPRFFEPGAMGGSSATRLLDAAFATGRAFSVSAQVH
jgi:hypothetical protein